MKILSFSALEILQGLLDRTKTQTIRPLFCKICTRKDKRVLGTSDQIPDMTPGVFVCGGHTPRFKAGEKIKLLWKCRSKADIFCNVCGKEINQGPWLTGGHPKSCLGGQMVEPFQKILGTGEITEVFIIEMYKEDKGGIDAFTVTAGNYTVNPVVPITLEENKARLKSLGQFDGFESQVNMFAWFDKKYDLSHPRRFACYRWKWL
jgi:hypothetical protein